MGSVAARILESTIIVAGIVSLLAVVTLRREFATSPGPDPTALTIVGRSLVAFHDATFLLAPGSWPASATG